MTPGWAIKLPREHLAAALPLRLRSDVEALDSGTDVWLRAVGPVDDVLSHQLRLIAGAGRFTFDADGRLTPDGNRLPIGSIPDGHWVPFSTLAVLILPPAALPAQPDQCVEVRLVRADVEAQIDGLLAPLDQWVAWSSAAPKVRLDRLRFAVRQDGLALIVGRPLPPIPGTGLTNHAGLLIPAGLAWHPAVDAETLRRVIKLPDGDFALFDPDGTHERIAAAMVVPATRAGARQAFESQR